MTDAPNNNIESLLSTYEAGVANPGEENAAAWLQARSSIEAVKEDLTTDQVKRLDNADKKLVAHADEVDIPETAGSHPRNEWWWYLDVLTEAGPVAAPAPSGGIASRIFTGIEVAVLLIAVFLLLRNFGVQPFAGMFQPPTPPTSTPAPTLTPPPTATLDVNAFNFDQAKVFSSNPAVVTIKVPASWKLPDPAPQGGAYNYTFSYGSPEAPSAQLQLSVESAKDFYSQVDQSGNSKSGTEALNAFKKARGGDGTDPTQPKFGDVKPGKLGTLDAATLSISVPGNVSQNQQPAEYTFYIADLAGTDRIAFIQTSYNKGVDPRLVETLGKMVESVTVNPGVIPTATPTATLHPLLMTATAVETQIIGLTPSPTATATATVTQTPGPGTPTAAPGTITASGLKIEDLTDGTGAEATTGKTVTVKYKGTLTNGTVFDSSYDRKAPDDVLKVKIGAGSVIKGWDEGLVGMKVGGKRRLTIPPELGYGAQANGSIPANSTLIFEIELVSVE